jgi:hypothetical protein
VDRGDTGPGGLRGGDRGACVSCVNTSSRVRFAPPPPATCKARGPQAAAPSWALGPGAGATHRRKTPAGRETGPTGPKRGTTAGPGPAVWRPCPATQRQAQGAGRARPRGTQGVRAPPPTHTTHERSLCSRSTEGTPVRVQVHVYPRHGTAPAAHRGSRGSATNTHPDVPRPLVGVTEHNSRWHSVVVVNDERQVQGFLKLSAGAPSSTVGTPPTHTSECPTHAAVGHWVAGN